MDYLTIFLILLSFVVLYKIFYARLFPIILDKLTHGHPKKFVEIKQKLFEGLKGKVLEIGPGTGCNFKIIAKENIESWTGIEPNPFMNVYIENSIKEYNIQFPTKIINEKAEDMKQIESNSMDFVILSHVFCSVESGGVEKVLDEILRVLKPGGKVIFLEHILDRNLTVKKIVILNNFNLVTNYCVSTLASFWIWL